MKMSHMRDLIIMGQLDNAQNVFVLNLNGFVIPSGILLKNKEQLKIIIPLKWNRGVGLDLRINLYGKFEYKTMKDTLGILTSLL
jgi:hypothetical protein